MAEKPSSKTFIDRMLSQIGGSEAEIASKQLSQEQHVDTCPLGAASHTMTFVRHAGKSDADPSQHFAELQQQAEALKRGDLSQIEEMLFGQAKTLETLFNHLSSLSSVMLLGKNPDRAIALLSASMKAQNQCRQTLVTLAEIKNPKKAVFIKRQQNLLQLERTKLQQLEASPYAEMDSRIERASETVDSTVEAVEVEHRTNQPRRKAKSRAK